MPMQKSKARKPGETRGRKKGDPTIKGNPNIGKHGPHVKEKEWMLNMSDEDRELVRGLLFETLEAYQKPKVLSAGEMEDRILDYYTRCAEKGIRPTVEEMYLYLGYPCETVEDWERGRHKCPFDSATVPALLKKAKSYMRSYDAKAVTMGKQNPVVYIFRAKNYYGMKDQQDIQITQPDTIGGNTDAGKLAETYLAQLPEDAASVPEAITVDYREIEPVPTNNSKVE